MVVRLIAARWCGLVAALVAVLLVPVSPVGAVAGFGDVDGGSYFADAVQWSVDNGITGVDGSCFSPDQPVTRGETAVWIWRMQDRPQAPAHSFVDVTAAEQQQSVAWMVSEGVTTGTSDSTFSPDRELTRVEVAAFLWRLASRPDAVAHSFVDVLSGWQQGPVSWMASTGITTGTSDSTFSPDGTLTRAQLITFLYRYNYSPTVTIDPDAPTCPPTEQEPEVVAPVDAGSGPYGDVTATVNRYGKIIHSTDTEIIIRLKDLGVFGGTECENGNFCPDDPIDQRTFSVWLMRVLDGVDDLETIGVCSTEPAESCSENSIPRDEMATFIDRYFVFPDVNMLGFVDVEEDNPHQDSIRRSWAAGIIDECNFDQAGPMLFCPDRAVSRAEAAKILSRALDWREAHDQMKPTGSETTIILGATYSETDFAATLTWSVPVSKRNQIDKFIVQWREPWRAFGLIRHETDYDIGRPWLMFQAHSHKVVDADPSKSSYSTMIELETHNDLYAARLVVVYKNADLLATDEVKVPANSHQIRDLIEQEIITPNQDSQPWLKDVWRHINDPGFGILASRSSGALVSLSAESRTRGEDKLELKTVDGIVISSRAVDNFDGYKETIIHEFGHIYTLTNNISSNPAPKGIGFVYLEQLYRKHSDNAKKKIRCVARELYADLAILAFYDPEVTLFDPYFGTQPGSGFELSYWAACGFNLPAAEDEEVYSIISDITKSVFLEQDMPDWLYDTYGNSDESIDLDNLWSDIHEEGFYTSMRVLIAHDLRKEFGGYCSDTNVHRLLDKEISELKNHWKDAGCDKEEPVAPTPINPPSSSNSNGEDNTGGGREIDHTVSYTLAYLARSKARPSKCWIAINGYVYDVTPREGGYEYPGPGSITEFCGQDATSHFSSNSLDPPGDDYKKGTLR